MQTPVAGYCNAARALQRYLGGPPLFRRIELATVRNGSPTLYRLDPQTAQFSAVDWPDLAKRIVEAHGGSLAVESTPGKGAVFIVAHSCRGLAAYTWVMGFGRILIVAGLVLLVAGLLFTFAERLPLKLGRLPGDIYYQGKTSTFYFPIATCILLSLLVSLVLWIVRR